MSGSTTVVSCQGHLFTRGHAHQLISRGLDDTPSFHSKSLEYQTSDSAHLIYKGGVSNYGIYDDVPDHGGRKQMGCGHSSPNRLTQSYHAHHNYPIRPHPPTTSYSYHPPTTSLAQSYNNHTPSYRNHITGYHSDDERIQSYHGNDTSRYRGDERARNTYHGNHTSHYGYHSDDRSAHGYHGDERLRSYHSNEKSHHSNERSHHSNEAIQHSYHSNEVSHHSYHNNERGHHSNEASHHSYHSNEGSQHSYHSNERGHHSNEATQNSYHSNERLQRGYSREQYDDRHSNLTSSVIYSRPQNRSNTWHSNSWSSYNKPHPLTNNGPHPSINNGSLINNGPRPSISSGPYPLINNQSRLLINNGPCPSINSSLNSPSSEPHPDSSPPSTRPHTGGVPYIDIISHPEDMGVAPHSRLVLTCEARLLHSNVAPVYQWFKDEDPLLGEIESVLIKESVGEEDTGFYFCIVSDVDQTTKRKSRQAYVYLDEEEEYHTLADPSPPVIIEQPPSTLTVLTGTRLHLKLHVQGVPEPIYRWFRNDMEMPQFTASELLIPCVTVRDEGRYVCLVKNDYGSILSGVITVKLISKALRSSSDSQLESTIIHDVRDEEIALPPSYTAPSSPQKLPSSLSFRPHPNPSTSLFSPSFEITPMTPPSVQVDDNMLVLVASQLKRQIDAYRICQLALCLGVATYELSVIKMKYPSLDEQILQVLTSWKDHTHHPTVGMLDDLLSMEGFIISLPHSFGATPAGAPPVIIRHPRNPHVAMDTAVLSVTAEGCGHLNYQWYKNNIALSNETSSQLHLYEPLESGLYHCIVSNSYGKAVSNPAFVGVSSSKIPPSMVNKGTPLGGQYTWNEGPSGDPLVNSLGGIIPRKESGDTLSLPSLDSMTCTNNVLAPPTSGGTLGMGEGLRERFDQLKLDKGEKPVILKHPISQEIANGDPLHLSVLADTPRSLKYIWYFNGLALCKETFPEFFLNCFTEEDIGDYYCEVSNNYDTVKSDIAKVSLKTSSND